MLKGYLILDETGQRMPVSGKLVIGRTKESDFLIDDASASRRHMEITARGERFIWEDLGSTNGTIVNGAQMLAGELKEGDQIRIGETLIRFEIEQAPAELPGKKDDSSLFRETILDASGQVQEGPQRDRTTSLLETIYTVVNEIATNYDLCNLLDRILQTIMPAIEAQRGAIFLAGQGGNLGPCPICGKVHRLSGGVLQPAVPGEIQISETVAHRVVRNGESVLYQDTDSNISATESIMALKLHSIICAPLRAKHGILGVLYIDSDRENVNYTHEDMLLATAVANSAGIALENARMHQEMLDKQRIEQEIATAWTIQEGFLVKDWRSSDPRYEVYGETLPAKTVGGDFYDFVKPGPGLIGLLIGDVSGKGVPAALTMAQLLAEFRLLARDLHSPADVIRALNEDLAERSQRGLFCTLCYLTLDLNSGEAVCANAGHWPVLRMGPAGVGRFAEASGPPAGILPDGPWEDARTTIQAGERLLLFTDGIAEARSMRTQTPFAQNEPDEYGIEGIIRVVAAGGLDSAKALVDALNEDVQQFCRPVSPHDDCTMIAVDYHGGAGRAGGQTGA